MTQALSKSDWRRVAQRETTRAHLTSQALQDLVEGIEKAAASSAPARAFRAVLASEAFEEAKRFA